tara:strand:+ start:9397 stop:10053 length:657 start_codon:yes stop_codon:yes gene_type:complete
MEKKLNTVEEAVDQLRNGGIVIVKDNPNREDEFDLICGAEHTTLEVVNFMSMHGRGAFVAVFMPYGLSDQLKIHPQGSFNDSYNQTKFRVSVDLAGCKSGSSAYDRAVTVQALGTEETKHYDFVRPGHVIPIEASRRLLFDRQGHTEAGVALAELAGLNIPAVSDIEILDLEGRMADLGFVETMRNNFSTDEFKGKPFYNMPIVTIGQIQDYYTQEGK